MSFCGAQHRAAHDNCTVLEGGAIHKSTLDSSKFGKFDRVCRGTYLQNVTTYNISALQDLVHEALLKIAEAAAPALHKLKLPVALAGP
jgi:hypothetical protein